MKKQFINTILCTFLAVMALGISSCQEFHIDSQKEYPLQIEIDAQPEYAVLALSPRSVVFNVSSNTPWRIESDQNWCVPTPAMSSASSLVAEVSVNIESNPEDVERTAVLTITADGIDGINTVTIKQVSKGYIHIQGFDNPFPSMGGDATLTIASNKPWKIVSSNQWLTLDKYEGTGNGETITINAKAAANTSFKRSATLTVISEGKETYLPVEQDGIQLEFEKTEDVIFDGGSDKESKIYTVISNIEWEVTTDAQWLKVEKNADGNVVATSLSEIYFANRKAVITIAPVNKAIKIDPVILEVSQPEGKYLTQAPAGGVTVDPETRAITFTENTGNANCRYWITKKRKLAIHEWTFSNVTVDGDRCLNMNCVANPSPSWNWWLGVGANPWVFRYRGGKLMEDTKCEPFEMNKLRGLKLEHNYVNPDDNTTANIRIFIKLDGATEWKEIITTPAYENGFVTAGLPGNTPYFGLINGSGGKKGTITITSYQVSNID